MNDKPIVMGNDGVQRQLPVNAPLVVGTPEEDDHAITLEVLQQLIEEKTNE